MAFGYSELGPRPVVLPVNAPIERGSHILLFFDGVVAIKCEIPLRREPSLLAYCRSCREYANEY